jgi:hypothetical protein
VHAGWVYDDAGWRVRGMHSFLKPLFILTLVFASLSVIAAWSTLNYRGYCFAEERYLTDQELTKIAVMDVFQSHAAFYRYKSGRTETGTLISYRNVDEFEELNRGCCKLTNYGKEGFTPSLSRRLAGYFRTFVHVNYMKERPFKNLSVPSQNDVYIAISNCGRPGNGLK